MIKSPITRWVLGVVVAISVLGLLRFRPWQHDGQGSARQDLKVGFLPVT